jgi:hypothetical protein
MTAIRFISAFERRQLIPPADGIAGIGARHDRRAGD